MSRNHFNELSPCEALIMKLIWGSTTGYSCTELIDQLRDDYGKDYARTTVVTFVGKLRTRDLLIHTVKERQLSFIHFVQKKNIEDSF